VTSARARSSRAARALVGRVPLAVPAVRVLRRARRDARRVRRNARGAILARALRGLDGPISESYGFDRGTPIDRFYIEDFLQTHAQDIRGHVLEVKDDAYSRRFGGGRVTAIDVVDVDPANELATIIADLDEPGSLEPGRFDCIVLTQVLQYLHPPIALRNLVDALAPGGTLLISAPSVSKLHRGTSDGWRFTARSLRALLETAVPVGAEVDVDQRGTAVAGASFLLGLAVEDVGQRSVLRDDPQHPVVALARVRVP
jgi:SAM-dependent methyltransferase